MIPLIGSRILFTFRLEHGNLADLVRVFSVACDVDELSKSPLLSGRCLLQKACLVDEPPVNEESGGSVL